MDTNSPKGRLKLNLQKCVNFRNAPCFRTVFLIYGSVIAILKLAVFMFELLDGGSWLDCKWKVSELLFVFCMQLGEKLLPLSQCTDRG